ncbi:thiamine pyrophosphokinase [Nereida ignava]|uniref:Thiamine diphosphokinase n=1 Tax=Nereida ignava TaxID=282199 RepID=A0A0U1NJF1_9RHOB|nr:thiamine diphosphokinase [Nereida ignava]CRK74850.1 thiamine pyrophosphokinase [Nereida ignava]SFJ62945.1 thiamine pyrophosphokinase [Nereida ignava DSM 16309]
MSKAIVSQNAPVLLVGGGTTHRDDWSLASKCGCVVAVDGGADAALANRVTPDFVIGDLDSISGAGHDKLADRVIAVSEQDTTDFDKALRNIDAPLIYAIGFTGARMDHSLAVLSGLVKAPKSRCIVVGEVDTVCLAPARLDFRDVTAQTRVSLFPMGPARASSTGLKWALDGIRFSPDSAIGTSNEALGGAVTIETYDPKMLLILPRTLIYVLADALRAAPSW